MAKNRASYFKECFEQDKYTVYSLGEVSKIHKTVSYVVHRYIQVAENIQRDVIYSEFMIVELETGHKKDETFSVLFYFIYFINKKYTIMAKC